MTEERIKPPRRIRRDLWVGWKPNGIGEQKPNHYGEMVKTVWENRKQLPYAYRILTQGVCDGCALGVAGLHDWTVDGIHLCTTRLNLLKVNTMGALDPAVLRDAKTVAKLKGKEMRELGRLAHPMVRRRGEPGFTQVSWDVALDLIAGAIRDAGPDRFGLFMTARGITNEVYYVAQKMVRAIGSNNVDNAARVCHAPSTTALKQAIGVAATTCSYTDVINSDLIVLFGADVANAQPVFVKYLYLAKKRGAKVIVVNPYREPGLERYWVPSNAESAIFGTKIADEFFSVHTGGDVAFVNGVLKCMLAMPKAIDSAFVAANTVGFEDVRAVIEAVSFEELESASGSTRAQMQRFADLYSAADGAILIWSMGITQHANGAENVAAVVNLGLARGNVGRANAGLMPIRGHSGVQGGAEMGCYSTAFPGGVSINEANAAVLSEQYGFPIRATPGLNAAEMVEAAGRGEFDVLYSSGGNFLDVLPAPDVVRSHLASTKVRVHQDIFLSSQMFVEPGEGAEMVVLLPAATRYEQRDGGTSTTTERRVAFSPEIRGPRPGEVRSEWEIFAEIARRAAPELLGRAAPELLEAAADFAARFGCDSGAAIREEIARVVPSYAGIEHLANTGDAIQWGGSRLCEGGVFETPDGKAHFQAVRHRDIEVPDGHFRCSTRRGKQFNSMVWQDKDPLTGARRDAVFIAPSDAETLGVKANDPVLLRSEFGEMAATIYIAEILAGNVQVFFPEGNPLLAADLRDPDSGVPDYNAIVEIIAGS